MRGAPTLPRIECLPKTRRRGTAFIQTLVAGINLLLTMCSSPAGSIVWTNTVGGNWSEPTNWNPNGIPGAGDRVIISQAGNYTVTLDTSAEAADLILGSGEVGAGIQTLVLTAEGKLSSASGVLQILGHMTNSGIVALTNSTINLSNGCLVNLAGGQIQLYGDASIVGMTSGQEAFVNEGLVSFLSPGIQKTMWQQSPFDSYPVLATSPDRRTLYMAFQGMTGNYFTTNSAIYFTVSTNNGVSWTAPVVIVTNPPQSHVWNPTLGTTASGRLVLLYQPVKIIPQIEFQPSVSVFSDDEGASWSQAGTIHTNGLPPSPYTHYVSWTPFGRITEHDGILYAGHYARAANNWYGLHCLKSSDGGSNWIGHRIAFAGLISEPAILPITSNLVLCVARSEMFSTNQVRFPKMFCYWSTNSGVDWFSGGHWLANSGPILNDPACLDVFQSPEGPRIAMVWGNRTDYELYASQALVADAFQSFTNLYLNRVSIGSIAKLGVNPDFGAGGYPQMTALNDDGLYLVTWYYEGGYSDPFISSIRLALVDFTGKSTGLTNLPAVIYETPGNAGAIAVSDFDNQDGVVNNQSLAGKLQIMSSGNASLAGLYAALTGTEVQFSGGTPAAPLSPSASFELEGNGRHQFLSGNLNFPIDDVPRMELIGGRLTLGENFQGGAITNLQLNGTTLTNQLPIAGSLLITNSMLEGIFAVEHGGHLNANGATLAGSLTVNQSGLATVAGLTVAGGASVTVAPSGHMKLEGASLFLHGALTNAGMITLTNYGFEIFNDGTSEHAGILFNQDGGVIHLYGVGGVDGHFGHERVVNAGLLTKSLDSGSALIDTAHFDSPGRISVEKGTLQLGHAIFQPSSDVTIRLNGLSDHAHLGINGHVNLRGNLTVAVAENVVLEPGGSVDVLSYASHSESFASHELPTQDSTVWRTEYHPTFLRLQVDGLPHVENIERSDEHLVLSGAGGTPGGEYFLLTSRDMTIPLPNWSVLTTNVFDGAGRFTITNRINLEEPQEFFRLQIR